MIKDDKHRTKALIDENRREIKISEKLKNLITNLQDEVHNVAISYHKNLRGKEMTKSALDEIEGIGPKKRQELLKEFKSIEGIKNATIEEIANVKGITFKLAETIKEQL